MRAASRKNKGSGTGNADITELLMRVVDLQSRVIEALAVAVGAITEPAEEEDEDDEEEDEEESEKEEE